MTYMIKCKGFHCPVKESCQRYTVEAHTPYQEYFSRIPFAGGSCRFKVEAETEEPHHIEAIFEPTQTVTVKPKREVRKPVRRKKK